MPFLYYPIFHPIFLFSPLIPLLSSRLLSSPLPSFPIPFFPLYSPHLFLRFFSLFNHLLSSPLYSSHLSSPISSLTPVPQELGGGSTEDDITVKLQEIIEVRMIIMIIKFACMFCNIVLHCMIQFNLYYTTLTKLSSFVPLKF